jgi:hypothetical protein
MPPDTDPAAHFKARSGGLAKPAIGDGPRQPCCLQDACLAEQKRVSYYLLTGRAVAWCAVPIYYYKECSTGR